MRTACTDGGDALGSSLVSLSALLSFSLPTTPCPGQVRLRSTTVFAIGGEDDGVSDTGRALSISLDEGSLSGNLIEASLRWPDVCPPMLEEPAWAEAMGCGKGRRRG